MIWKREKKWQETLPNPELDQAVASFINMANSATGKQVTENVFGSGHSLRPLGEKAADEANLI